MTNATSTSNYSTQFGTELLQAINAPVTQANLDFLAAWNQFESGSPATQAKGTASYNPFNTEKAEPGDVPFTFAPNIPSYQDQQTGVAATASTLLQSNMSALLNALRGGNSAGADAQALAQTPWGSGAGVESVLASGHVYAPAAAISGSSVPNSSPTSWITDIPGVSSALGGLKGDVVDPAAKGAASATADAVGGIISAITAPFEKYLEDAALVLFGLILMVVGLIMLAHASDNSGASSSSSSGSSGSSSSSSSKKGKEKDAGESGAGAGAGAGVADDAALAAVAA